MDRYDYRDTLKNILEFHVRPEQREEFLCSLLRTTNQYASSEVWGVVVDLLQKDYNYSYKKIMRIIRKEEK